MKKVIAVLSIVVLASCGGNSTEVVSDSTSVDSVKVDSVVVDSTVSVDTSVVK